jgi:hypothetical protein
MVRVSVGAIATEWEDVMAGWGAMQLAAAAR